MLRERAVPSVAGNYDSKVLKFPEKQGKWRKKKSAQKFLAFQWANHTLTNRSLEYLRALPPERVVEALAVRVLLTHGSPASPKGHLTPQTRESRMQELASMVEVDVVVCGHSHQPFVWQVAGVYCINPASVGRPDDGNYQASYAIAKFGRGGPRRVYVRHHRISYDAARAAYSTTSAGWKGGAGITGPRFGWCSSA